MTREFIDRLNALVVKEMENYITKLEKTNMALVDMVKEYGLTESEIKKKLEYKLGSDNAVEEE